MITKYGLYFAWLLAAIGTLISLYFSEVKMMEPCHLCWYQRICLFPLVILLGIAAYRGFLGIASYALPLAALGFMLALYQVMMQEIPGWNPIDICGGGPSCDDGITVLGPITIPMLSMACFGVISALLSLVWYRSCPSHEIH
ncbi:MAG: disulfide formation protein [Chlamydiales bacterium]|nr:disulfide formation protein [Chlamydiales bacterium]MCH9635874.1 disulfide formation protein [Chlamydiales bacterium]MCH9704390.1 disulfide bond formation protein B [Chlamydiota bacterium]